MLHAADSQDRLNDFVIKLANVNGTGSASANTLLMKSIFRMGIPVMGKNYFPSNIQGLPTWYEIRVTRDGYVARSGRVDVMVAMNAETYAKDVKEVSPGGYLVYDSTWPRPALLKRDDITILGAPFARMCNETFQGVRSRILLKNIMYSGVLAALLDIDMEIMRAMLGESYASKKSLLDSNVKALEIGYNYAKEHFQCPLPLRVQRMDQTSNHIMIDGNTAAALGCLYAGATVGAWYPITPSTSLMDSFKSFCQKWRVDPQTGERNFVIVQCEDELAAIGAVIGAMWNGARAFTPTSGPGISLMNEFIGLAYYAEVPAVIFDIQRVGPSTGMPTRTQQCDLMLAAYASHGDTRHVLLFPNSPEECFYMSVEAFDLAERLQTPVFVMSDLDIGMNDWMCPALKWDDNVPSGPRQGAEQGADRAARQVPPLLRQGRRRDPVPHAAGRASEGRVLHARLRPHAVRRIHRGCDRLPDRARPAREEIRDGEAAGAESGVRRQELARRRHRLDRQLRRRRAANRSTSSSAAACRWTTCASAASRSARRSRNSSRRIRCCSWSSRTATRSSRAC